ncbi:MAG TPA: efflux RND transporter periplasmic adaptor subunit [Desulfobulbus sp.]|nr:efflux RND transporter periplasmic adaptor subunit [Desulfobulbus sp.]
MKSRIQDLIMCTCLLAAAAVIAPAGLVGVATVTSTAVAGENPQQEEKKPLFYRSPMNPAVTSPVPAKDEMGMDYIPVYADDDTTGPPGTVKIDPVMVQKIGVRTAMAMKRSMSREVRTPARIAFNEASLSMVHSKFSGWAEELFVSKTGQQVKKGEPLFSIYSPELVSTQEEYLLALANARILARSSLAEIREGAKRLVEATRSRLEFFDIPDSVINTLEKTGRIERDITIISPYQGTVIRMGIRAGHYLTPKDELYRIADLSTVWVYADVYEDDLPWIRTGDKATMTVTTQPGTVFSGTVDYIYPYEEGETRTVKVRLVFRNRDFGLRPGMFAGVTIHASRRDNVLAVPSEAIVRSGTEALVFIRRGEGLFEPRKVVTGLVADGYTEIVSGLKEHETVVTSAQFLIDSESKLKEATAKMLERSAAGKPALKMDMNKDAKDANNAKDGKAMKDMKTGTGTDRTPTTR